MKGRSRSVAAVLAVLLSTGCASTPKTVPVMGRTVRADVNGKPVKGELLVVGDGEMWIRSKDGVEAVPLSTVRQVSVKRHNFGARQVLTWAAIGGLATGGTLYASCESVEGGESCLGIGLAVLASWALVGGIAAPLAEQSSYSRLERPLVEELRPFARLPQGLPPDVPPAALVGPPPPKKR